MIYIFIILIILSLLIIYTIFREIDKKRKLGKLLIKVKHNISSFILMVPLVLLESVSILFIIKNINDLTITSGYDVNIFILYLVYAFLVLVLFIFMLIRVMQSREVRENGMTFKGGSIDSHYIRDITWLSENTVEINYVGSFIHFNAKEKWKVNKGQKDELKKILQEEYYSNKTKYKFDNEGER